MGWLKETPDLLLKAASGFVNLIRISDTPLLDRILLPPPHNSMLTSHILVYDSRATLLQYYNCFTAVLAIVERKLVWKLEMSKTLN